MIYERNLRGLGKSKWWLIEIIVEKNRNICFYYYSHASIFTKDDL